MNDDKAPDFSPKACDARDPGPVSAQGRGVWLDEARRLPVGRGLVWIREAARLVAERPGLWLAVWLLVLLLLPLSLLILMPLSALLLQSFFIPLSGWIALMVHKQLVGETPRVLDLFATDWRAEYGYSLAFGIVFALIGAFFLSMPEDDMATVMGLFCLLPPILLATLIGACAPTLARVHPGRPYGFKSLVTALKNLPPLLVNALVVLPLPALLSYALWRVLVACHASLQECGWVPPALLFWLFCAPVYFLMSALAARDMFFDESSQVEPKERERSALRRIIGTEPCSLLVLLMLLSFAAFSFIEDRAVLRQGEEALTESRALLLKQDYVAAQRTLAQAKQRISDAKLCLLSFKKGDLLVRINEALNTEEFKSGLAGGQGRGR